MKYFGTAYYPEHETWDDFIKDISVMKEAGFNIVRIGEFSWCRMEPRDSEFTLSWLDDFINEMGKNGIYSILCTPTAAPPAWLCEKHPEIMYVDARGVTRPFGGRRHYCYNSPVYRRYAERIALELGRRYSGHPFVMGFHIDNEIAQEATGRCHCPVCAEKFRDWLKTRYETIENLNQKAGTIFWGQEYGHFGQIRPPASTIELDALPLLPKFHDNPTLRLDFERFCSDSLTAYVEIQLDAIRSKSEKPVTTNSTGICTNSINYYTMFKRLDPVSLDDYPVLRNNGMSKTSFIYAFARGVRQQNFWLVETSASGGHGLWSGEGWLQPFPGAIYTNAIHAFISGADVMTYFQFKAFRFGAEQLDEAVMDIDNIPRRRFREMQRVGEEMRKITPLLEESVIRNDVAICFDYESLWSLKIKPFHADFNYEDFLVNIYRHFTETGVGVDIIPFSNDIHRYKVVILPVAAIINNDFKEELISFVKNGGTLLSTFLTSIKDEYNTAPRVSTPGGLTELFGLRVAEAEPVFSESVSRIELDSISGTNCFWTESLEPIGAEVIGKYADTFRKDEAVICRNQYGAGVAYYMGTWVEDRLLYRLFDRILEEKQIMRVFTERYHGVEAVHRKFRGRSVIFVFNFNEKEIHAELSDTYENQNGGLLSRKWLLPPKSYDILFHKT